MGEGAVVGFAQLYGLEDFILGQITVLEGDTTLLSDPSQNAIAAVYSADEYGVIDENVNCFKVRGYRDPALCGEVGER